MKAEPPTFQFKIIIFDIMPPAWRGIQVPADNSFRDLHVAIEDEMRRQDYHLNGFFFPLAHPAAGDQGLPLCVAS